MGRNPMVGRRASTRHVATQLPLIPLAFALSVVQLLPVGARSWATTLQHVDTRDLTLGSSDIVIGFVESSRSYWNEKHTRILTDVTVRVERALKGAVGQRLTLTQLGGVVDGARYSIPGCPAFRDGEEAL